MPRPGFHRLPEDERARLLGLAAERFAADGYGTSYNALIEATGLSKGSMYHYFDGKADLFAAVCEGALASFLDAATLPGDATDAEGFWAELHTVYGRVARLLDDDPQRAALARTFLAARGEPDLAGMWTSMERAMLEPLREELARGQALGAVRDDLDDELLLAAVAGLGEALDLHLFTRWPSLTPEERGALVAQNVALLRDLAGAR